MDIYDVAVDYFIESTKEETFQAWSAPNRHPYGYLFCHSTPTGKPDHTYGCPSQIARGALIQGDDDNSLAKAIRAKYDIVQPLKNYEVDEGDLHKYAEIQRRINTIHPNRHEHLTRWAATHKEEIEAFQRELAAREKVVE